jgi:basic amino acid/polyamine antiporter, APA family
MAGSDRAALSLRRLATDATIAGLAFAYSLWTIAGSGYQVVFRGFILRMAGVPVYVLMKWRGLRADETHAAEVVTTSSDGEPPLGLTA